VALWGLVARAGSSDLIPAPWDVATQVWRDGAYYLPHIRQTGTEALLGYLLGNAAALVTAVVLTLAPVAERTTRPLFVALHCLPIMVAAPLADALLPRDAALAAVAAQAVFLATLAHALVGLRSCDTRLLDVVSAAGGNRWARLSKVRIASALPAVFAGLRAAVPAAFLGAVVAEFAGATRGLGVAMMAGLQGFRIARTWGLAVVLLALTGMASWVMGRIGGRFTGWASSGTTVPAHRVIQTATRPTRALHSAAGIMAGVVLVAAVWWATISAFQLDPFFAKTPGQVLHYLFGTRDAPRHRAQLLLDLGQTFLDTALGYVAGSAVALSLGIACSLHRTTARLVLSAAAALRTIPVVATAPLVTLAVGRAAACVVVVTGFVTLFPSLVGVLEGLDSAPRAAIDMAATYGGRPWALLLRVRLPFAVPMLTAMARLMVPSALLAALVAEWLATGSGLGNRMLLAFAQSDFTLLWSSAAVAVAAAAVMQGVVGVAGSVLLRRFSSVAASEP